MRLYGSLGGVSIAATVTALGHKRRLMHPAATSVITPNADIRLRCTK
jgi:hypothetical protein